MRVATVSLREIKENCEQAFQKPRNRTLERYKFEPLRQFLHTLTGLAAKYDYGDQTDSLIMAPFIQNMNNKTVQQKLCTERKDNLQEAFRFAVAYEEKIRQRKTFEGMKEVKSEPVCPVNEQRNPCTGGGLEINKMNDHCISRLGAHRLVVEACGLYWGGSKIESLSTQLSLKRVFHAYFSVNLVTKNNSYGGET